MIVWDFGMEDKVVAQEQNPDGSYSDGVGCVGNGLRQQAGSQWNRL